MALVLDTSVLFAAHVTDEDQHRSCRELIESRAEPLVIPVPVFVELEYLFHKRTTMNAWLHFAEDVLGGAYKIFPLDSVALVTAAKLQARYRTLRLGLVDAAVFTCCIALNEHKVATLDRRHFSILRSDSGQALELLPQLDI